MHLHLAESENRPKEKKAPAWPPMTAKKAPGGLLDVAQEWKETRGRAGLTEPTQVAKATAPAPIRRRKLVEGLYPEGCARKQEGLSEAKGQQPAGHKSTGGKKTHLGWGMLPKSC